MREQRVIIFGGPDRCGKTTIAKELSRVLDIPYFKPIGQQATALHDPAEFVQQVQYAEPKLLDFLQQTRYSAIMDRGFPCEWAYSKAFERETDWKMLEWLDGMHAKLGTLLVFTLRKDYTGKRDDADGRIDQRKLELIDGWYRVYQKKSRCDTLVLETDDEFLEQQVKIIMEAM